ncbi:hypothetical protein [Lysinibacillus sp. NPDC096212]|uniref:hypothetical protein n=1 Tax=unclassified Lysinibacillus TaxID=2636778 RepID=UPI0037F53EBE
MVESNEREKGGWDGNYESRRKTSPFTTREPIGEVLSGEALAKAAIKYKANGGKRGI